MTRGEQNARPAGRGAGAAVVHDVLRHRIGITYEAEAENITSEEIINKIVNEVEVP